MTPAEVVQEVIASGLRGRGGGGYPTGLKWSTVAKMSDAQKYVICNADEGDPGAFMDRAVLESDPHRVLEGMAIAAYAVGANKGYVYVRAEYPLAVERLTTAIRKAKRSGFLGQQGGRDAVRFEVEIRLGAGAFVCGEETALMASIEGLRGQPRPRPPYPAEYGLWGHPTLINNVETFANIAPIVRNGGAWFASIGTREVEGHEGVRARRHDREHRPDRSADGHHAARHHRGDRRRHPGRQGGSRRCRPAGRRAAACPRRTSTCRSTTTA